MTLFLPLSLTVVEKTRCQHEREHILGTADSPRPQPPGLFVPECDEHGQYVPTQCHSGTGYCWCVDRDGREVQGTRTRSGMRPPCKSESRAGDGTSGHLQALLGTLAWGIAGTFCLPWILTCSTDSKPVPSLPLSPLQPPFPSPYNSQPSSPSLSPLTLSLLSPFSFPFRCKPVLCKWWAGPAG